MLIRYLFSLLCVTSIDTYHFSGGTIRWEPIDPYDNSNSTVITIIQSYIWDDPLIFCGTNVPISTSSTYSYMNLTCVGNCSADGGYSTKPINTLTDCTSSNPTMDVLLSQKSRNITLTADAHFHLINRGSGWPDLNQPPDPTANWSIVFYIDLRKRPDGFINTPPSASVYSPQYAIVNIPIQFRISASDANTGDDIRCRWAKKFTNPSIDECGGACYPSSMPTSATLSNCILNFTGPFSNTWYVVAIQVEDFSNTTSNVSMSSVPVQFLIYVQSTPACSLSPVIMPFTGCTEASMNVSRSFNISVLNFCDPFIVDIADIVVSQSINGMTVSTLKYSATNSSVCYKTFTWTPRANQIGSQQLCLIAFTEANVQSTEYCITFNVIPTSPPCATTTTTSTATTSTSRTTSTTSTTTTATSTTTTTTSTSTSTTSTTTTTTTTTSTSTSTTSTTTTTTSTSTSTTSTTTTTTSTSTSTTSTTTTTTTTTTASTTTSVTTIRPIGVDSSTNAPGTTTSWGLIAGIASLALPLGLCTFCCLYRLLWNPAAKRRRQLEFREEEEENTWGYNSLNATMNNTTQIEGSQTLENSTIEVPKTSYQVYNITAKATEVNTDSSANCGQGSVLFSIYNNTNGRRTNGMGTQNNVESLEMGHTKTHLKVGEQTNWSSSKQNVINTDQGNNEENFRAPSVPFFATNRVGDFQSRSETSFQMNQSQRPNGNSFGLKDWSRIYLFGTGSKTDISPTQKSS